MDSQPKKKKPRTFEPMTSGSWGAWSTTELRSTEHIKLNFDLFNIFEEAFFCELKNFSRMQFSFWQRNFFAAKFSSISVRYEIARLWKTDSFFSSSYSIAFCAINVFLDENWAFGQLTSVRHKKNYMTANFAFLQHSKKILVGSVQFIFRLHNFHFLKIGEKLHGRIIYSDFYKKMFIKISLKLTCKESS